MDFRTKIHIPEADFKINHKHNMTFLGSCFSDNIGNQCMEHKFNALSNPFGVLYNPVVTADHIRRMLHDDKDFVPQLHKSNELWYDYRFHGSFSHPDKTVAGNNMVNAFDKAKNHLKQTDVLFITWGTSIVYRLKISGETVANCHKQPSTTFTRDKLAVNSIITDYSDFLNSIIKHNHNIRIVFTVSPVRHLKDGFIENQRSKAVLLLAAEALEKKFSQVSYFPSYEILMDDLRDYRFYNKDLTHPSPEAVDYLWNRFGDTYFNSETKYLNEQIRKIRDAYHHRVLYPETDEATKFAQHQMMLIETWREKVPHLDFTEEYNHFKDMMH
ncbi:MAG: GSCFA domain-containing protein [Bacteroidota bacterium]|nr:GSCFA domain-containing protein [Bacteroidota bacterium]